MANNFWADKRVCVTGGRGFLGSYVSNQVRDCGAKQVIALDHIDYDLRSQAETVELFDDFGTPDIIFHLAATVGGIGANQANPGRFFYDNVMMGVNLIEESRKRGVKKFVCVGTTCSYPKYTPIPFKEEDFWSGYPEETNAPYGIAKKALLTQLQAYRQEYGFDGIYLVPTNLYGPHDKFIPDKAHVIPDMIRKFVIARKSSASSVSVWGTGNATRDFIYASDAADGIVRAAEFYDDPQPLNIGHGEGVSIRQLAALIQKLTGYSGEIVWDTSKPDGQPRRVLDISRVEKEIGWRPTTTLEDGLQKTIEWYEQNLHEDVSHGR